MKRVRIEKPKRRVDRWWLEVLPIDPRDPDVARAKTIDQAGGSDRRNSGRRALP
jgi:hypothetical protein